MLIYTNSRKHILTQETLYGIHIRRVFTQWKQIPVTTETVISLRLTDASLLFRCYITAILRKDLNNVNYTRKEGDRYPEMVHP